MKEVFFFILLGTVSLMIEHPKDNLFQWTEEYLPLFGQTAREESKMLKKVMKELRLPFARLFLLLCIYKVMTAWLVLVIKRAVVV